MSRRSRLLRWYQSHHRNLPWRQIRDPYRIWISEVMLQQTQVDTVIPFYRKFLKRFPTIRSLARADLSDVLKVWEGLGYYARARHLHKAAKLLVAEHGGKLPNNYADLRRIPGIGDYTAAAISSIVFGEPAAVLDGNARRVMARWIALRDDVAATESQKLLTAAAQQNLDRRQPGDWNQAVMELGATICLPRNPRCGDCPVAFSCEGNHLNLQHLIPVKKPRKAIPHYQVTAAVLEKNGRILIARRHEKGLLGGLWEFPGGKQEAGETLPAALKRELREELAIEVKVGEKFQEVDHSYSHFRITLHVFRCRLISGRPKPRGCAEIKWVKPHELNRYAFPRADRRVIEKLMV
jgi:A/G-specific adenine glycosylase